MRGHAMHHRFCVRRVCIMSAEKSLTLKGEVGPVKSSNGFSVLNIDRPPNEILQQAVICLTATGNSADYSHHQGQRK